MSAFLRLEVSSLDELARVRGRNSPPYRSKGQSASERSRARALLKKLSVDRNRMILLWSRRQIMQPRRIMKSAIVQG